MHKNGKKISILFTSVGRRVELVQAFSSAAKKIGVELCLCGADLSEVAPALYFCNKKIVSPRISDPGYIDFLLSVCEEYKVDMLIPTIDTDLLLLSQNRTRFEAIGTKVLIADEDKVAVCRNKKLTADYFSKCGLKSPKPVDDYREYSGGFPAFIKPKDGSSSIDAYKINSENELESFSRKVKDYIIQPFISGREYTIDIFCDYRGNPVFITPRERLATRSGEVLKTKIVKDSTMIAEAKAIIADFKPRGPITVQLIREETTGTDYFIEINPRFGGGAPLSIKAGADSAEAAIRLALDEELCYHDTAAADGSVFSRYDQCVCISHGKAELKGVVFDLDDTLYNEKQYVISGYRRVAEYLGISQAADEMYCCFKNGENAIDSTLKNRGIYSEDLKQQCLKVYREHFPDISLNDGVAHLLKALRKKGIKIGIITDGRPEGQKAKIAALKLRDFVDEIIITDELGGTVFRKPCDIAFRIMQRKFNIPFENMIYVGDNPEKDFIAPIQLGMQTLFFKNTEGIYHSDFNNFMPAEYITDNLNDFFKDYVV